MTKCSSLGLGAKLSFVVLLCTKSLWRAKRFGGGTVFCGGMDGILVWASRPCLISPQCPNMVILSSDAEGAMS